METAVSTDPWLPPYRVSRNLVIWLTTDPYAGVYAILIFPASFPFALRMRWALLVGLR